MVNNYEFNLLKNKLYLSNNKVMIRNYVKTITSNFGFTRNTGKHQ
jgi:hypothetical protein